MHPYTKEENMRKAHHLRKEFGFKTGRELADVLYHEHGCIIDPRTLIAYERGNKDIDPMIEKKLAVVYQTTVEELRKDDGVKWTQNVAR